MARTTRTRTTPAVAAGREINIDASAAAAPRSIVQRASTMLLERFGLAKRTRRGRPDLVHAPALDAAGRLEAVCVGCDPHVIVFQFDPATSTDDLEALYVRHLEESGWTFTASGALCPECSQ